MGKIILVTVPIGNTDDITSRALNYLKSGTIFFVEDTRSFKSLLKNLGIAIEGKKIDSFHDQTHIRKVDHILKQTENYDVYIVSEAGSPYLSDPAYPLVKDAIEKGILVETTGGINSAIYALELSGFPANPFKFHGFLGRDSGTRKASFKQLMGETGTHIFFEGVSRVDSFIKDLAKVLPEVSVVIARELSKTHETVYRFQAADYEDVLKEMVMKGEFVILIHIEEAKPYQELIEYADKVLKDKGKKKTLAKLLSQILIRPVNDIYAELGE